MAASSATGFTIISRVDGSVSMRKAMDYLKRFRAFVERNRNPFRGLLEARPDEIRFMDSTGTTWRIAWTNIRKIAAFKRDLFSTDLICWELELKEGFRRGWEEIKVIEIDEEIEGFQGVFEEAVRRNMVAPNWLALVMQPAFATNWTIIYDSSVPGSADSHVSPAH